MRLLLDQVFLVFFPPLKKNNKKNPNRSLKSEKHSEGALTVEQRHYRYENQQADAHMASPYHHNFSLTKNSGIHSLSRTISKKQVGSEDPKRLQCNLMKWPGLVIAPNAAETFEVREKMGSLSSRLSMTEGGCCLVTVFLEDSEQNIVGISY